MMVGSRGDYPIINIEEIHMIFYKVEELQAAHKNFYKQLEPRLTQWSKNQIIGDLFEDLVVSTVILCTGHYFILHTTSVDICPMTSFICSRCVVGL